MPQRAGKICLPYLLIALAVGPQPHATPTGAQAPKSAEPVQKLGDNLFLLGQIRVNTANREITVPGIINGNVMTLEFVANTRRGMKAYESALTLDTDAVTFNAALMLIGLDPAHAKVPVRHFDPSPPEGDAVEIWIECPGGQCKRMKAEQLMFDRATNTPLADGQWVYTGSRFLPDGRYLAEMDGVLIGFVHDPASIIELVRGAGLGRYGSVIMNTKLGLPPRTSVTVTVKSIAPAGRH